MFILYAVVLGIILGYITGGRMKNVAQRPLHWKGLALSAFAIQLVIFSNVPFMASVPKPVTVVLHYASYLLLLIFIIMNLKNTGIIIVGTGIFLNTLVIFLNGGYMPTIPENLKNTSVGKTAEAISQGIAVNNSAKMAGDTLLPWLGDVFYLPSWVPFSNVFSIGDILIAAGICVYIVINMRPVKR